MGAFLDKPVTTKDVEEGVDVNARSYCVTSMQGWRSDQEDAHVAVGDFHSGWSLFGKQCPHVGHGCKPRSGALRITEVMQASSMGMAAPKSRSLWLIICRTCCVRGQSFPRQILHSRFSGHSWSSTLLLKQALMS